MTSSRIFHAIIFLYCLFAIWYIFNDPDCTQANYTMAYAWLDIKDVIEFIKEVFNA